MSRFFIVSAILNCIWDLMSIFKVQGQNELGHGFFFIGVEQSSISLAVTVQHSFNAGGPGWGIR